MKKRKKKNDTMAMPASPASWSPKKERRYSAESMADTMMRTHPKLKSMKNHIANAVEKAAHRAVTNRIQRGSFGY